MTREEKKLILKDLGGRLAFGVKCYITEVDATRILGAIQEDGENTLYDFWEDDRKIQYMYQLYTSEFKPCLFPMSSMTEEQIKEFNSITQHCDTYTVKSIRLIDFCNKHHLDWRGLIPKGLALDATGLNIY